MMKLALYRCQRIEWIGFIICAGLALFWVWQTIDFLVLEHFFFTVLSFISLFWFSFFTFRYGVCLYRTRPVLILCQEGIFFDEMRHAIMPWSMIKDVQHYSAGNERYLRITLLDARFLEDHYGGDGHQIRIAPWLPGIDIRLHGLKISEKELQEHILAKLQAYAENPAADFNCSQKKDLCIISALRASDFLVG